MRKKNPITDLKISEIVPATVILLFLLLLGLWPKIISERVDHEINSRYSNINSDYSSTLPPCCPPKGIDSSFESNQSSIHKSLNQIHIK